jgi:Heterokaryon incompatibility protein (HET)
MSGIQYRPLKGTEIRVLAIDGLGRSDIVQCHLIYAPLAELSYTALSYCWADPSVTETILVNGKAVEVTINLESCLRKLAEKPLDDLGSTLDQEFLLWVDALCIDQNTTSERNHQVQKMGTIFSSAKEIIVWLGSEGKNTKAAIEHIKLASRSTDDIRAAIPELNDRESNFEQGAVSMLQEQDSLAGRGWIELLENPWFQRLWPVQEYVLAKAVRFVCGDDILADEQFRSAILSELTHHTRQQDKFPTAWAGNLFTRQRVKRLRNLMQDRNSGYARLQTLLETFASREATDLRDKVYGLLGIATDFQEGELVPDYDLSPCDVYMAAVNAHLVKYDTLSILGQCYSGHTDTPAKQPTWIPPWELSVSDNAYLAYPDPLEWESYNEIGASPEFRLPYYASGNLKLSTHAWHLNKETGTLHLTGNCVSTIARISNMESSNSILEDHESTARAWLSLASELDPMYKFTNEMTTAALRRTMLADFISTEQGPYRGDMMLLSEDLPICVNGVMVNYQDVMMTFISRARNRKIVVTSDGWLGLVPECATIGDQVAVLVGGQTLYVLRRWDQHTSVPVTSERCNHFSLVGEAYFHGFMDGEALGLGEMGEIVLH